MEQKQGCCSDSSRHMGDQCCIPHPRQVLSAPLIPGDIKSDNDNSATGAARVSDHNAFQSFCNHLIASVAALHMVTTAAHMFGRQHAEQHPRHYFHGRYRHHLVSSYARRPPSYTLLRRCHLQVWCSPPPLETGTVLYLSSRRYFGSLIYFTFVRVSFGPYSLSLLRFRQQ